VLTDLFTRLEASGKLPTPPGVVLRLLELTRRNDVSVREIAETIALDPALSAKILRFVNSPMAGVAREVTSLMQAVNLMGIRGVKMMALSFSVLNPGNKAQIPAFDAELFSIQSLACGSAGRIIATLTQSGSPQEAFLAGLLSQIGRSALATAVPEEYAAVLAAAGNIPRDLPAIERPALGGTYPEVGGQLLRAWGIPEQLCQAVESFRARGEEPSASWLERILNAGELAASVVCPGGASADPFADEFAAVARRCFGIKPEQCIEVLREVAADVENARALLDVPKSRLRTASQIEAEVRERITELSLAMHLENQSLARQQEELLRRATTDPLTGVGNRAAFDARMSLELERAARTGSPFGLLMIDVDYFKKFNDTYGHLAGDRILQSVARLLDENIRKVDYVARYGGEEFAVVAPSTAPEGVAFLAERLRRSVESMSMAWDGTPLRVTVSIGVGLLKEVTDTRDAASAVIRAADEQLYAAKCAGRNRVSLQPPPATVSGKLEPRVRQPSPV
jgi:diguanylate cyclase (GGDEF)-like protein